MYRSIYKSSVLLPYVELAGVDPYHVMHDAVEDGVDDGVTAETSVPFLGRQLGHEWPAKQNQANPYE